MSQWLFYLLGAVASLGFIASNYSLNKKMVLLFQTIGSISVSLQFLVIDIYSVAAVNAIFIVRNIIIFWMETANSTPQKNYLRNIGVIGFLALLIIYPISNSFPNELGIGVMLYTLPLLAGVFNIIAIAQSKLVNLKWFIFLSVLCWAVFDVLTGAWTTLVGDSFSVVACLIAIYRLNKKKA